MLLFVTIATITECIQNVILENPTPVVQCKDKKKRFRLQNADTKKRKCKGLKKRNKCNHTLENGKKVVL